MKQILKWLSGILLCLALTLGLLAGLSVTAYAASNHNTHNDISFTAWNSADSLPGSEALTNGVGSFYLTKDVTISSIWTVPSGTVNLCLNGHGLIGGGSNTILRIPTGSTLNLYDCDTVTTHRYDIKEFLATVNENGEYSFTGGYIAGGNGGGDTSNSVFAGGVYIDGGTFNMYGGTIIGNTMKQSNNGGAGVDVYGGTFNMHGGLITGNKSSGTGGGVFVKDRGSATAYFNMYGGEIKGNLALSNGGGVFITTGQFTMTGGKITNNICGYKGGGVYVNENQYAVFKLSGDPTVMGNTDVYGEKNNIFLGNSNNYASTLKIIGNLSLPANANTPAIGIGRAGAGVFTSSTDTTYNDASKFSSDGYDGTTFIVGKNQAGQLLLGAPKTVTYEANGGSGEMTDNDSPYASGSMVNVLANTMTREGYTFTGWKIGTGDTIYANAADNITGAAASYTITADTTLTAQWTANTYTVTLDNQGATTAGAASVTATFDSVLPSITSLPEKTGYTFGGYFSETNGGGTQYLNADGTPTTAVWTTAGTGTLYALWKHTCSNITFTAWIGDGLPNTAGNWALTKNVTLSSQWSAPKGTTNLCLNGKSITSNGTTALQVSSNKTLNLFDHNETNSGTVTCSSGYGVLVAGTGTVNMYGGTITGCKTGIRVEDSGSTATMYAGTVTENTENGVETVSGTFVLQNGSITNNTKKGIYVGYGSTFRLGGTGIAPVITGNGYGVFLEGTTIGVEDGTTLSGSARIPVRMETKLGKTTGTFITGLTVPEGVFTSENGDGYGVHIIDNGAEMWLVPATAPTINTQPQNLNLAYGYTEGNLSVTATATTDTTYGDLTYQWYSNTTNSNTGGVQIVNASDAIYTIPTGKNAGTTEYYYCVVTATRTDNSQTATATSDAATVTVGKAAAPELTNSQKPTAKENLAYTGKPQELVTAPTSIPDGYTGVLYAIGINNTTPPDESAYTTSIPKATDAGTYYVWYKAVGDANHSDSAPVCLPVTIHLAEPVITGADLVLNASLDFRFYVALPVDFDSTGAHMVFTIHGRTVDVPFSKAETSTAAATQGRKIFSCPVYSIEMAEPVEAVFHYTKGGTAKTTTRTASIKDYLDALDKQSGNTDALKALIAAVRNYGHYIQPYLARLHGFTVGAGGYPTMPAATASLEPATAQDLEPYKTKWNDYDGTLLESVNYYDTFDTSTYLNIQVKLKSARTLTATVNGAAVEVTELGGNVYAVRTPGIAANNLGTPARVVFSAGSTVICDIDVSTLTYVRAVLASGRNEADELDALTAFYNYYAAAKDYAG